MTWLLIDCSSKYGSEFIKIRKSLALLATGEDLAKLLRKCPDPKQEFDNDGFKISRRFYQ